MVTFLVEAGLAGAAGYWLTNFTMRAWLLVLLGIIAGIGVGLLASATMAAGTYMLGLDLHAGRTVGRAIQGAFTLGPLLTVISAFSWRHLKQPA